MTDIQSPNRRLDALFREFDSLAAENRNALDGTDKKLGISLGVAATLIAAGFWRSEPAFFLIVPYLILAIAFFAAVQLSQIVVLGAQLAVVEKRINQELEHHVMSYFSVTVPTVCDAPKLIDPRSEGEHYTFNAINAVSAAIVLVAIVVFSIIKGLPALIVKGWTPTVLYFAGVFAAFAVVALVLVRATMAKGMLIAVIERALEAKRNEPLERP